MYPAYFYSKQMEPDKRLYIQIIIQLLEDIILDNPVAVSIAEGKLAKLQARAWFLANSEDYKVICECADINASMLRKTVLNSKPPYTELKILVYEYSQAD